MFTIIITAGISSSVSLHIELILIVICDGVNSAVIQWLDWSVVVAHERRISTMFTLKFPELVKLKHTQKNMSSKETYDPSSGLRYFDRVFGRPYQCFPITFKNILSLSDRHKIFTSD